MGSDSLVRLAIVQGLYGRLLGGVGCELLGEVYAVYKKEDGLCETEIPIDKGYFGRVVESVASYAVEIDKEIEGVLADGRKIGSVPLLIRAILYGGVAELLYNMEVSSKGIVAGYTDISGAFFGAKETNFVNAVLDNKRRELRPDK